MMNYQPIFDRLWADYTSQNPSALAVYKLFVSHGETVNNDHIAFRTFNHPKLGIDVLAVPFIKAGFQEMGTYHFEEKKLFAKHFHHPNFPESPRVFISELLVEKLSTETQNIINGIYNAIDFDKIDANELYLAGNIWGTPSFETYNKLREESEYAAWLYVYGYRANHFTVDVNSLKKFPTLESVNQLLKDNGFMLNTSGGEIKGTPEELLQQSSTMADFIEVKFKEGAYKIPACYYEFARRFPDASGKLYGGFIAKSADKIFESTNFYQKPE